MLTKQEIEIEEDTNKRNKEILYSLVFAIQTTISSVNRFAPSHSIFGRDVIMREKEVVKWHDKWLRWAEQAFKKDMREIRKSFNHKYNIGDKVSSDYENK